MKYKVTGYQYKSYTDDFSSAVYMANKIAIDNKSWGKVEINNRKDLYNCYSGEDGLFGEYTQLAHKLFKEL